eukprot:3790756-Amphidinium_carterae.2
MEGHCTHSHTEPTHQEMIVNRKFRKMGRAVVGRACLTCLRLIRRESSVFPPPPLSETSCNEASPPPDILAQVA